MHWVSLWIFKPDVIWIHPELCHIVGDLLLQLRDILLCCHIVGVGYQRHLGPNTKFKSRFELSENYQTIIKELSGNYQNIIRKLTGNYKRIINYQGIIRDTIDQMPNSSQESNDLRSPQRIWECLWQCWGGWQEGCTWIKIMIDKVILKQVWSKHEQVGSTRWFKPSLQALKLR